MINDNKKIIYTGIGILIFIYLLSRAKAKPEEEFRTIEIMVIE